MMDANKYDLLKVYDRLNNRSINTNTNFNTNIDNSNVNSSSDAEIQDRLDEEYI